MKKTDAARIGELLAEADMVDGSVTLGRILCALKRNWPEHDWACLVGRFSENKTRPYALLQNAEADRSNAIEELAHRRRLLSEAFAKDDKSEVAVILASISVLERRAGLPRRS